MKNLPPVKVKKRVKSPDKGSLLLDEEELHMNERAIMALMRMLDIYEDVPYLDWSQHEAEEIAFSRCAIEEILQLVWDHPWTIASETIENFAEKMEFFRDLAVTNEQRRIFSVMAETALEVYQEIEPLDRFVT